MSNGFPRPAPQFTCPVHGSTVHEWAEGRFSCSVKPGMGQPGTNQNGYCDQKFGPSKQQGGKGNWRPKSPEEQRAIAAQSCFSSACARFAGDPKATNAEIVALAKLGYDFVAEKGKGTASGSPSPRATPVQAVPTQPAASTTYPPGEDPFPPEGGDPGPW